MIGSLIRLLVFAAVVAAATWGVSILLEAEGGVTIALAGYEFALTPLAAAAVLVVAAGALIVVIRAVDLIVATTLFILGDPQAVRRFTDETRKRRGIETLDATLMALANGDGKRAQKSAARAERLLRRPGLTRLLMAQASELAGDTRRARRYWRALAEEPDTAALGLKGLLAQALSAGDTERARALAEQAAEIAPQDPSIWADLYRLQSEAYDWAGARRTLATQRRLGALPRPEADRREATLALAQAEEAAAARDRQQSRAFALEAVKLDPANAEAATAAARELALQGHTKSAARHLMEAWRRAPSPEIARAYAALEPTESPLQRRKRFEKLFAANSDHPEARFVSAELALLARDWAGARAALDALGEDVPSARSCALMAAIARGEGEPEAVIRGWLAKALGAPRDGGATEIAQTAMLPLLIDDADEDAPSDKTGGRRAAPEVAAVDGEDASASDAEAGGRTGDAPPAQADHAQRDQKGRDPRAAAGPGRTSES
ncbi:MAG: heme biosynthesis protein HemY [Pikeienuella sp.]